MPRPPLVDSHCHLTYPGLIEQQSEVLERARATGITAMLSIATRLSEWAEIQALADREDDIWCSVGIHPHHAADISDQKRLYDDLIAQTAHARSVALGETGLDYAYDNSPRDVQRQVFATHIRAAQVCGMPLVVHTRDAGKDTKSLMQNAWKEKPYKAVIHCFTESADFARFALDLGFYISFSGIVTFKNARDLQDVAKFIPLDRLLVETDAPFLAPTPLRGKTCEPAYVEHTARFLAKIKGVSLEEIARQTTENFRTLFERVRLPATA